jgi:hypothetical protein
MTLTNPIEWNDRERERKNTDGGLRINQHLFSLAIILTHESSFSDILYSNGTGEEKNALKSASRS